MTDEQIVEVWALFKEYLDKKTVTMVAEKYVDLLADYGVTDLVFKESMGGDAELDDAIGYYLELDNAENTEWDD